MFSSPFGNSGAANDGGDDIMKLKMMLVYIRCSQDDDGGDVAGEVDDDGGDVGGEVVKTKKARKS